MFKATHFQTGEVRTGSFEELCDLDKRQWELEPVVLKSHSKVVEKVICRVKTFAFSPAFGGRCVAWHPVFSHQQFMRKEDTNGGKNQDSPTI